MRLSPDEIVVFDAFGAPFTLSVVGTWGVMACAIAALIFWRGSALVSAAVEFAAEQCESITGRRDRDIASFAGSLFVFILACNWSSLVPGFMPPTASLSTTLALASCSMAATAYFGIKARGTAYFKGLFEPFFAMLPLNAIGAASRGFSLCIRLYGNVMSGAFLGAMAFSLAPLFFPALLGIYGLIAGTLQPFIFMILTLVYIGSSINQQQGEVKC
ncbi:MAG: F0F1 ATP synthase subunit A [Rickettsiales bacterium]|jgi:F-type H+-transporting ATPase subunit a|nr:F0F1 ATP synthase subunit A [Rickettsiales bacterium]